MAQSTCQAPVRGSLTGCCADGGYKTKVVFKVENMENGKPGEFVVEVHPEWAPLGAERFLELVKDGFFEGSRFHKVLAGFSASFGISGHPIKTKEMKMRRLKDEPMVEMNTRGRLAFVPSGPDSRSTEIVISEKKNEVFDKEGYVPFATVAGGMAVVDRLYSGYGATGPPRGRGPSTERIEQEGNHYLIEQFPRMSWIKSVQIVEDEASDPADLPLAQAKTGFSLRSVVDPRMALIGVGVISIVAAVYAWAGPAKTIHV